MTIRQHAAAAAALALLLAPLALFAQETKKLTDSSVPATVSIADADYLYVVQGGVSKRGTAGQLRAVTDTHVANDLTIESSATIGTDSCVRIGDRDAATNAVQICRSTADDRLYHDTDADGTKDTGEEFIDQAGGGSSTEYDPKEHPSSCDTCDEFIGGTTSLTYEWQNQESSSAAVALDGLTMSHPIDSTGFAAYYFTGPSGAATDWVVSSLVSAGDFRLSFNAAGIGILAAGTRASPTLMYFHSVYSNGGQLTTGMRSVTGYASAQSTIGSNWNVHGNSHFLQIRYVSASKELSTWHSTDGIMWRKNGSTTLGAHPTTDFFLMIQSASASEEATANFRFVRVRTDATGTTEPYPVGE